MGKRLRSLASVLWDSDTEQPQNYFGVENNQHGQQRELQLENDSLKSQVHDLTCEVEDLKNGLQLCRSSKMTWSLLSLWKP